MGHSGFGALCVTSEYAITTPVLIAGNVATIAGGGRQYYFDFAGNSLFQTTDGVYYATGYNASGQLADGTLTERYPPGEMILEAPGYLENTSLANTFAPGASNLELGFRSNVNWTITSIPSWISASASSGRGFSSLQITALNNPGSDDRVGQIVFSSDPTPDTLIVEYRQKGFSFRISSFTSSSGLQSLSWVSVPEERYQLWESTNLKDWTPLGDEIVASDSSISLDLPSYSGKFYKVTVVASP